MYVFASVNFRISAKDTRIDEGSNRKMYVKLIKNWFSHKLLSFEE